MKKLTHRVKVLMAAVALLAFAGLYAEHSLATNPSDRLVKSSSVPDGRLVFSSPVPAVSGGPK